MRPSKYDKALKALSKNPCFKSSEAKKMGIPARMLLYFYKRGRLERIGRGIYRSLEYESGLGLEVEDLILTAKSVPHGVICLISALNIYELTDEIMREYWIAIPNKDRAPTRLHTRIVRMRNITLGATEMKIGTHIIKIFDKERTIVDTFRYLSREIAIKALRGYLKPTKTHKPDLEKLLYYAKNLRVNLDPYILTLTT